VGPDRGAGWRVPPSVADEQAPLELLRAVPAAWARELADALSQAGVPHRVEASRTSPSDDGTFGGPPEYAIWVRAEDRARASRIDEELFRRHVPDASEGSARELELPRLDTRGLVLRVVTVLILSALLMLLTQLFGRD
jgi:hypothetical protein